MSMQEGAIEAPFIQAGLRPRPSRISSAIRLARTKPLGAFALLLIVIMFLLAILSARGPGIINVIIAIAFTTVPRINRVVRATVLSEKHNMNVDAARSIGCTQKRVMWKHIFPNVTAPIIIIGATELGAAIL